MDEVRYLQDYMTVELLYQFSRQAIMKVVYWEYTRRLLDGVDYWQVYWSILFLQGEIVTDDACIFELAACVMQVQCGEYKK